MEIAGFRPIRLDTEWRVTLDTYKPLFLVSIRHLCDQFSNAINNTCAYVVLEHALEADLILPHQAGEVRVNLFHYITVHLQMKLLCELRDKQLVLLDKIYTTMMSDKALRSLIFQINRHRASKDVELA